MPLTITQKKQMMKKTNYSTPLLELKFSQPADASPRFEGYAARFDVLDTYGHYIRRGAFAKTLQNRARPVLLRWNHVGPVIGKWISIEEDGIGLKVVGELTAGHSVANDAAALLKHGAISGLSIGFFRKKATKNNDLTTNLEELDLIEISIVEEPAQSEAGVTEIKSAVHMIKSSDDAIEYLLSSGLSIADASAFLDRIRIVFDEEEDAAEAMRAEIKSALGLK